MGQTGYSSPAYGASFAPFGVPVTLPRSGIQTVQCPITDGLSDIHGVYPFVTARDWLAIKDDLKNLHGNAVAAVFVTNPFSDQDLANSDLETVLDVMRVFKTHYVVKLGGDWRRTSRDRTQRYARRSLDAHDISIREARPQDMPEFWAHYSTLIDRHQVQGMQATSPSIIEVQLSVPGAYIVKASGREGSSAQMILYGEDSVLYTHLIGISPKGYKTFVSYAIYQATLEWAEANGFGYVSLGGVAGAVADAENGLATFKRGWANQSRSTFLCGKILDERRYRDLLTDETREISFFPAYRHQHKLAPIGTSAAP